MMSVLYVPECAALYVYARSCVCVCVCVGCARARTNNSLVRSSYG